MRKRCRQFEWLLRVGMTLWLSILACSVSISHAHADGTDSHDHGHGWSMLWKAPNSPSWLDTDPADQRQHLLLFRPEADPADWHQHLLLLGFELLRDPNPPAVPHAAIDLTLPGYEPPPISWKWDGMSTDFLLTTHHTTTLNATSSSSHYFAPPCRLTHFAHRRVSGVLRP